jgi:MFS family permease
VPSPPPPPPPPPIRRSVPPPHYEEPYDDPRYDDRRYPDERYDDRRYPDGRRHDDRRYPDERYDDRRYPDGRRHDDPRYDDRRYPDERYDDRRYPDGRRHDDPRYDDRRHPDERYRDRRRPPNSVERYDDAPYGDVPADAAANQRPAVALTKAAVRHTNRAARVVTRKVITASKADGAEESGLTALIWNQVLSYGTDAMITVALAGSVFFGASAHAQRGNVLLYLLITMAPFAVVAPVIGPLLDRLQHGRRWAMATTAIGRGVLALVMANYASELLVLYPCALGSLVFSKAYGVIRAAAAPRLVPPNLSLTEANARLTIFGLGSTLVLGGAVGVIIKVTGSYSIGLFITAIGFFACAFFAFKLPANVDSAAAARRHPQEPPRPQLQTKVPPMTRLQSWARRGFEEHIVIALQGESALRLLSGLLTIYLAFYIETTQHGLKGVVQLGGVVAAAGAGNFIGTAIGTRLKFGKPEVVIIVSTCAAAAACLMAVLLFSIFVAILVMLVGAVANALSKIALDALIQRDVVETLRSTAFGKSETFLQLAWVLGAALGVVLPSSKGDGRWGFLAAALIVGAAGILIVLRHRATARSDAHRDWPQRPGSVARDPHHP